MATLDRAIAHSVFLMGCVVLEGGWGLEWRLLLVATLAALPLSSVSGAASRHRHLLSAPESLLVLYLRSVHFVRDRRTHARSFEETGRAFS